MRMNIPRGWERLFLGLSPSISLSFFRIFVALTVGLHVIPSFFHLEDNYLSTAFKTVNFSFFTPEAIALVQRSPDSIVYFFVILFCGAWFFFLIGFFSWLSCILMTLGCYYFYALNAFHIGTLSWDILLVTLFLMCVTPYHGDYFSVDVLRRGQPDSYKRERPFFVQRLLQLQIASTYFYTALHKITVSGNWLTGNPMYYLMNYPPEGVVKQFIFRDFFAARPEICFTMGVAIVICEILLPFLLFIPQTRLWAVSLGVFFHIVLVLTLHVPTIFFFLFPPQLFLFINPQNIIRWIERKRNLSRHQGQAQIIYDGHCQFCVRSINVLLTMDLFGFLKPVDYHSVDDVKRFHPNLTREICHSQLHLMEPQGRLSGGFFIFRRLCLKIPLLYPFIVIFYFPGLRIVGPWIYRWVAKNRYLLHRAKVCQDNTCFR